VNDHTDIVDKAKNELAKADRVDVGDNWFEVIKLPYDVFAIIENGHVQEVCSFLIIGTEKAVLFDTGMGISDISAVVKQLTDLEITIVNSHTHFDHIGDDWRFPVIRVFKDDYAAGILKRGFSHWDVRYDADPELFSKDYPSGFDPTKYHIKPIEEERIHLLQDGDIINLGNRQLNVYHTPGHTQDGIMLYDRETKGLFTGDTFCGLLFAFFVPHFPHYGKSDLQDYEQTMKKMAKLVPFLDYLYPSHSPPLANPDILVDVASAFEMLKKGEAKFYYERLYGENRRVYEFNGFSIWT